MARIFYGVAGEGRGHATRAGTIVEHLRREHDVVLFAPAHAHDMLARRYAGTEVEVRRIEGPRFCYRDDHRIDKVRTALATLGYVSRLPSLVGRLARAIDRERVDLVLTDFDPALPRAAERTGVPYVAVDHQHVLVASDLSCLPARLRSWARVMSFVVRAYYRRQVATVVSSFYRPPPRRGWERAVRGGVMLRPEVVGVRPEVGAHLCVYLRRHAPDSVLDALAGTGREARVYGLGARPARGRIRFLPIDERAFVEDLATCDALVSTAGNQLVGEALWLGKPVLAMPETGNEEQEINAFFLARSGAGVVHDAHRLRSADVEAFLAEAPWLRARIDRSGLDGTRAALATIRAVLADSASAPARTGALVTP